MHLSTYILLFLSTIYAVDASGACAVTMPMEGTIWKIGDTVTIGWSRVDQETIPSITLAQRYADGTYNNVAKLATSVPAAPGKYSLRVPSNIVSSNDYAILLGEAESFDCASGTLAVENVGNALPAGEVSSPVEPVEPVGVTSTSKSLGPTSGSQTSAVSLGTGNGNAQATETASALDGSSLPTHSKMAVDSMETGKTPSSGNTAPRLGWAVGQMCSFMVLAAVLGVVIY